jgi:branched-chain amino acid transport system permease protein
MIDFVQTTIDGVMIGASYGLLALGFTLTFGVMRRLNLSYGPSIMIGAYLGTLLYVQQGAAPEAVAAVTVLGAALAGIYVERLCFAPLAAGAGIASMVSSFAIWMQLEQAAILILPRHTYPFPPLATAAPLSLGPLLFRIDHLFMLVAALVLALAVHIFLHRSRFGLALRAIIDNPLAAHLSGINVNTAIVYAFAGASALGGIAGFLVLASDQQVTPMFGMWATMKGLIAMMIGGLGSTHGAVLGGLVLGVVEAHSLWHFGPQVRDLVTYLLLFGCLVLRPGGILGAAPTRSTLESNGPVMRGLVPRIHVFALKEDADGRDKHGHDAEGLRRDRRSG